MQKHGKKKILAVVEDLLFTVKISDAAKRAGLDVEFVKSERDVIDKSYWTSTSLPFNRSS